MAALAKLCESSSVTSRECVPTTVSASAAAAAQHHDAATVRRAAIQLEQSSSRAEPEAPMAARRRQQQREPLTILCDPTVATTVSSLASLVDLFHSVAVDSRVVRETTVQWWRRCGT